MTDKHSSGYTPRAIRKYVAVAFFLLAIVFILPANDKALHLYHLSATEYKIILFSVLLPLLVVWLAAFYGYSKLQEYAHIIKKTPDAQAFEDLARGCKWLAWSLIIPAIVSIVLGAIANQWEAFYTASRIITNYTNLLFPLVGFSIIAKSSRELVGRAKVRIGSLNARGIMLLFVVGGALYCYLIFQRFGTSSLGSTDNPYYMPVWLVLLTVIIPYLYTWFIGLLASYEMAIYSKQVKGVLYRQALHLLLSGLTAIILGSIALQYIRSLQPSSGHLSLNYSLLLILMFYIINGLGFALLAIGAQRLKKIEEV